MMTIGMGTRMGVEAAAIPLAFGTVLTLVGAVSGNLRH